MVQWQFSSEQLPPRTIAPMKSPPPPRQLPPRLLTFTPRQLSLNNSPWTATTRTIAPHEIPPRTITPWMFALETIAPELFPPGQLPLGQLPPMKSPQDN